MPSTINDNSTVSFSVKMTGTEAYAFSQFLKRVAWRDYRELAVSSDDANNMLRAGEVIRSALREQVGFTPR